MDERPNKRRGPITLLMSSRRFRWWTAVTVVTACLAYALSSGPTRVVASEGGLRLANGVELQRFSWWWTTAYSPLIWVSARPWGGPVRWYWSLFSGENRPKTSVDRQLHRRHGRNQPL